MSEVFGGKLGTGAAVVFRPVGVQLEAGNSALAMYLSWPRTDAAWRARATDMISTDQECEASSDQKLKREAPA